MRNELFAPLDPFIGLGRFDFERSLSRLPTTGGAVGMLYGPGWFESRSLAPTSVFSTFPESPCPRTLVLSAVVAKEFDLSLGWP